MSNSAFANPSLPTMEDVISIIMKADDLTDRKKREIRLGITTACRWFGIERRQLIAHPANLRPRFRKLSAGGLGVSRKRISNVKSAVKRGLTYVASNDDRTYLAPLTPEWSSLDALVQDQYRRASLSRFMRYCAARGLSPVAINDGVSQEFLDALTNEQLVANPRRIHGCAVNAWDTLAAGEPAWPKVRLTKPNYSPAYILNTFRPELMASIEAFLEQGACSDPFDLSGRVKPLKPSSIATYRDRLLRFASLVVLAGRDINSLRSLADLVPVETVKLGLSYLIDRGEGKPRALAALIARLLAQVSRDFVKWPEDKARDENVRALLKMSQKLNGARGLSRKNRERLAPLKHEANLARLFLLPFAIAHAYPR